MSASPVQGKNVILKAYNADGYYKFYCAQTAELSIDTDQLPATNVNSGGWKSFKPAKTGWALTLTGVTHVRDTIGDNNLTVFDITNEQIRKNGIDLYMVFTNDQGNVETFTGHANPVNTTLGGTAGQLSKFSIQFQGTGAFGRNTTISNPQSNDVKRYEYVAAGGETSFTYADLINRNYLEVSREASPTMALIYNGTPSDKQALITASLGKVEFSNALMPGEVVVVLYN